MKHTLKAVGLLIIMMLLTVGLAQQQQQTGQQTQQQTQETQQQQGEQGQDGQQNQQGQQGMSTDELFVMAAAHGDMYEIASSQLATERSTNENIQEFAQRLVEDHTTSSERLAEIAEQAGIVMPMDRADGTQAGSAQAGTEGTSSEQTETNQTEQTQTAQAQAGQEQAGTEQPEQMPAMMTPSPVHQLKLIELMNLDGEAFDRAYVMQQVLAHQAAIHFFEIQAEHGEEEELRNFANESLPTLREHLSMAMDLMEQLGMSLEDMPGGQNTNGQSGGSN